MEIAEIREVGASLELLARAMDEAGAGYLLESLVIRIRDIADRLEAQEDERERPKSPARNRALG